MRGANSSFSLMNTKLITLLSLLFLFIVFIILRSYGPKEQPAYVKSQNCPTSCDKIPSTLSEALIHYATSKTTPQQTTHEIHVTERVLRRKSPCNLLVFGLGHDSLMWDSLNYGGKTVFLEEDKKWIATMKSKFPNLDSRHVTYDTKVRNSDNLLNSAKGTKECEHVIDPRESNCTLALKNLPKDIYEVEWDLIMVDAPTGYHVEAPGRMTALYTAGLMGRNKDDGETDVFIHDVDRPIENVFSKEFLCEGYLIEQVGRLRHFTIPSHKARLGRPFCPTIVSKN